MPVKHFELLSIEGKRFSKMQRIPPNVRIDHNLSIGLITERSKREVEIEFKVTASYSTADHQGLGVISIEGTLVYEGDANEIAHQWRTRREMPDKAATEIPQTIMSNCLTEMVIIARDIRLPPPVPYPRIKLGGKPKESTGVEVA
ncbi:MAG: hypothetical protein ACE5QF_07870 [Thermoplasmata archaeon]